MRVVGVLIESVFGSFEIVLERVGVCWVCCLSLLGF